jgi:uncharacterized protein YecE (DUF72 family)
MGFPQTVQNPNGRCFPNRPSDPKGNLSRWGPFSFTADGWQGSFYPPGMETRSFLSYYATKFKTVEIDSTCYGTPRASTVMNWYERTPPDVKALMQLNGTSWSMAKGETILLTPDEELRDIQFVAFILSDLLRHCAQRLFVCVLWQLPMTSDYLFSAFNPHQPIRFVCVP